MKNIVECFKYKNQEWKRKRNKNKKIKMMQKHDPFVYKH